MLNILNVTAVKKSCQLCSKINGSGRRCVLKEIDYPCITVGPSVALVYNPIRFKIYPRSTEKKIEKWTKPICKVNDGLYILTMDLFDTSSQR